MGNNCGQELSGVYPEDADSSGTLKLTVFEKEIKGKKFSYLNYFVTLNRSYPDPENNGKYIDTNVMNPQDLLLVADFYRAPWDFILEQ